MSPEKIQSCELNKDEVVFEPARTKYGLVVPPDVATITPEKKLFFQERTRIDRHHLYYPKRVFHEAGEIPTIFREHRFNSVWIPRFQHDRLHRRYEHGVRDNPTKFLVSEEVMVAFLDEARLLDQLNVCVRAVDMIDDAIYEGQVKHLSHSLARREEHTETIATVLQMTKDFEVIPKPVLTAVLQNTLIEKLAS